VQQLKPKKQLGQNFLVDQQIVYLLVDSANIKKDETIVEPGSGTGVVTEELISTGANIVGVEIDNDLIPMLKNKFKNSLNFHLETGSVLESSFESLSNGDNYKVVGAIPYQISSPLIHKILFEKVKPSVVCIILQKEVAEKIVGGERKGSYMSSMVGLFYDSKIIKFIKPEAFFPAPKVDSAILLLTLKNDLPDIDLKKFKGFLHKAFANRRKMLNKTFNTQQLDQSGIADTARPQELSLTNFIKLYNNINNV